MRRAAADFLVGILASKVGPAQMGPIACAKGWEFFYCCAQANLCERGNDLSHQQTGGARPASLPPPRRFEPRGLQVRSHAGSKKYREKWFGAGEPQRVAGRRISRRSSVTRLACLDTYEPRRLTASVVNGPPLRREDIATFGKEPA